MNNFVISIGRQLGSGGKEIAEKLGKRLGIAVYDKKLLEVAARDSGLDTTVFEGADEKESNALFGNLFGLRDSMINYFSGHGSCIESDRLFEIQSEAIRKIAASEPCITIGRCAEYILRDHPRMLSIFITADTADRIHRIMSKEHTTEPKARELMEKGDKRRKAYHDYYATDEWGAAKSYDLCINSSRLGIDGTVDFIYEYVKRHFAL